MSSATSRTLLVILVVALGVVPMVAASGYTLFQLTLVVSYALSVLGLNMVTGYNGQISLGHGAFYAIGAYTTAIMMDHWALPYWATIPVAGAGIDVTATATRAVAARAIGVGIGAAGAVGANTPRQCCRTVTAHSVSRNTKLSNRRYFYCRDGTSNAINDCLRIQSVLRPVKQEIKRLRT